MRQPEGYRELIEVNEDLISRYKRERDILIGKGSPEGIKAERSYKDYDNIHGIGGRMSAETLISEVMRINKRIRELEEDNAQMKENCRKVENVLPYLKHNKSRVRYLRDYCGMSLLEISEMLDLSYQYIRRLAMEINKK